MSFINVHSGNGDIGTSMWPIAFPQVAITITPCGGFVINDLTAPISAGMSSSTFSDEVAPSAIVQGF